MDNNSYLNEVVQQSALVEDQLRARKSNLAPAAAAVAKGGSVATFRKMGMAAGVEEEEASLPAPSVNYRITGFWHWKTVVVPPNVYVVHTRRGHAEPLHLGLGVSFRYDPATDAFLVIPAAVQTLLINARCISAERQGVLVQAYVQWVVDDIRTAYRKLDFGDSTDPMRIVNIQLREQAEAAIKDKVATMPIDAILSDKQPIIEELTTRLRGVAESREGAVTSGLGLKIVTVQIKEAVVSSTRLWENLQKPFRVGREQLARMAELETQEAIARQESTNRQSRETAQIETERRLEALRAEQVREVYDREQAEQLRRHQVEEGLAIQQHDLDARRVSRELEDIRRQLDLERARAELQRLQAETAIDRENLDHAARSKREERDVEVLARRRVVENDLSEAHVKAQLISRLPEIAQAMPKPDELRSIQINGDGATGVTGLLAQMLQSLEGLAAGHVRKG
jgi:flotillin